MSKLILDINDRIEAVADDCTASLSASYAALDAEL
jgi:hypothetical protein